MTKPSSKSASKPLAITLGEPAGIGPDLLLALATEPREIPWVIYGDAELLRARASTLGLSVTVDTAVGAPSAAGGKLTVHHVPLAAEVVAGTLNVRNAAAVVQTLDTAATACIHGEARALVTAPVQKSVIADAGITFTGHTEFLCTHAQAEDVVMLLVGGGLRVALATTHLALAEVPAAITTPLLTRRLGILHAALKAQFGVHNPRILLAGLNPHAGEGGHLGQEDAQVITPVAEDLRARGWDVVGPLPADTLFTPNLLEGADAVMAMYHDQGLPVLKALSFGRAVNVTLGLPYVRTSVDHGTALDLAGTGRADAGSLREAIELAIELTA